MMRRASCEALLAHSGTATCIIILQASIFFLKESTSRLLSLSV